MGAAGYYAGLPEVNLEFGDLPSAYSLTVLNDNGARHSTSSSLYLGASVDEETDGQASADAGRAATGGDDGTNSDDEDGVGVVGTWQEGANGGTVDVVVTGGAGCLSGWIDWNTNDSFGDSGDQVLDMVAVSAGANRLTFDIPIGALPTTDLYDRFSRFRLAPDTGAQGDCSDDNVLALTGLVNGGEVEDHYLRFSLPTGTGPGGVARSDGATSLALWLDAGAGTSSTTDGTPVSNWGDQSGYGHDAGQGSPGSQPTYQANVQNGRPVLRFDDSDDGMSVADTLSLNAPYSVFAVFNTTGSTANRRAVQGRDADWLIGPHSGEVRHYAPSDWVSTGLGLSQGQFYIAAATNSGSASAFWVDGVDQTSNTSPVGAPGKLGLGATGTAAEPLGGDLAEVIVYSTNLNSARRAIVENYLQARYNDSTADDLTIATDLYDGDTGANGNFDMDVAGIGRETDGDNWTAHSAGIIVQDVNFLQDNGDYLLYGHNTPANDNTTADVPTTGAWDGVDDQRWLRHWYFDRTDVGTTGGLVDIVFDYSEAGMDAKLPGGSAGNYRLLRRTNATGQFEDITATCTGGAWVSGDQITFRNVDVTCLGSNFTLGTLDAGSSPTTVRLRDASAQSRGAGTTAGLPVAGITLSLITLAAGLLIVRRRR